MPDTTTTRRSVPGAERKNGVATHPAPTSPLNIEVTTVTPDMANAWLARGGKNRKLNERRVDVLVAALHRGEWQLTGEAIKLDADGKVRDGQHRLRAVVKSGVPIQTVVVRGVEAAAADVMDSGRARSTADVLGMHGHVSQTATASAVRLLIMLERSGRIDATRATERYLSTAVALKYLSEHDDVLNGVRLGDRVRKAKLMGSAGTWGGLFTIFLRIDAEAAYQFAHFLSTGEDMTYGHPALVLRNRLLGLKANGGDQREEAAALIIKAWNAFRKGESIRYLAWRRDGLRPEAFPKPL